MEEITVDIYKKIEIHIKINILYNFIKSNIS